MKTRKNIEDLQEFEVCLRALLTEKQYAWLLKYTEDNQKGMIQGYRMTNLTKAQQSEHQTTKQFLKDNIELIIECIGHDINGGFVKEKIGKDVCVIVGLAIGVLCTDIPKKLPKGVLWFERLETTD